MKKKNWYKLDNVGKFYASIASKEIPNVFRYSAVLTERIEEDILQKALDSTIEVYPNFNVNLKRGIFWYYLEETTNKVIVTKENLPICFRLYNSDDDFLYRVSYFENKINFEISHILSDGRGSVEFFKMLVSNYLKIKHSLKKLYLTSKSSDSESFEDSFNKYYQKTKSPKSKKVKIYKYQSRKLKNQIRYMEMHLNTKEVLSLAHKNETSLTAFLVSVLIYSCKDVMSLRDMRKEIKIDIPVDLRSYFKSSSLRNFFGLTSVSYKFKNKEDSLTEIISSINQQFKENITVENLSKRVNSMVAFEKNVFCRFVPIFIKNFALLLIDKLSSNSNTSCLSNIGIIKFDDKVSDYIKSVSVITSTTSFQLTLCSYKDDLSISISSIYQTNDIIKNFCRFFSNQNIKVVINSNEVD